MDVAELLRLFPSLPLGWLSRLLNKQKDADKATTHKHAATTAAAATTTSTNRKQKEEDKNVFRSSLLKALVCAARHLVKTSQAHPRAREWAMASDRSASDSDESSAAVEADKRLKDDADELEAWSDDAAMKGDEDDNEDWMEAAQPLKKQKKAPGGQAKPKAKAKSKAAAKTKAGPKLCFVCPARISGKSRWCQQHTKDYNAMRHQAERAGTVNVFEEVMEDENKARDALKDFQTQNAGGRFRKKLLDWGQWQRMYGKKRSKTNRDKLILMDADDYCGYILGKRPHWSKQDAFADWEK